MSLSQVKAAVESTLLGTPGVVGVGGSKDKLIVYVGGSPDTVPKSIAGYTVKVVKVGHVKALSASLSPQPFPSTSPTLYYVLQPVPEVVELARSLEAERMGRIRPVPGGVSVGHPSISAGTLGTAISVGGVLYGLSNNHILAASSTKQVVRARVGDLILQPGKADGGVSPGDVVGTLHKYVPLDEMGPNLTDCALFKPTSPDLLSPEILGLSPFTGFKAAEVDMPVAKSGRTSGVSLGKVVDTDATMTVDYGLFQATFRRQIVSEFMASPGDSGSLTVDPLDYKAVGLVYAGSEYITMHNHIGDVIASLAVAPRVPGVPPLLGLLSIPFGVALTVMA